MNSPRRPERNLPKLNATTLDFISRGFAHSKGREMTMVDLKAMSLSDAKSHIATAKQLSSSTAAKKTDQSFLHALEKEHARRKVRNKWLAAGGAAVIVLLGLVASLGGGEPAQSSQQTRDVSTTKTAATDDDESQVKGTATTVVDESESAPTPQPSIPPTASVPVPQPVPPPKQKPKIDVFRGVPPPAPTPVAISCDANYAGGCVPAVADDLDCADIGFAVEVIGEDPHGFDADGDGSGCESYQ